VTQYARDIALLSEDMAILRTELYASFSELPEHFPQVEQVLLEHAANHNHVVQV
jgi:hypothetical protein